MCALHFVICYNITVHVSNKVQSLDWERMVLSEKKFESEVNVLKCDKGTVVP